MLYLSLVGEQPIPVLLPALHIKYDRHILVCSKLTETVAVRLAKILPHSSVLRLNSGAYDLDLMTEEILSFAQGDQLFFNITGGTKLMSLAMYRVALQTNSPIGYLQSETHRSILYTYQPSGQSGLSASNEELPELINIDQYLLAHLDGYREEGVSKDEGGDLEMRLKIELEKAGYEVKAGVRPAKAGDQLEIDLVVRKGNQVGIVEAKWGDRRGESAKRAIDQLTTASAREYLGTYTARFLVIGRIASPQIKELALRQNVKVVELPGYQPGRPLPTDQVDRLKSAFREKLEGRLR